MPILKRRPLRDRLAALLVADAVAAGADPVKVSEVVADLVAERPILDWLFKEGGWEQLVATLLKLLALFANEKS